MIVPPAPPSPPRLFLTSTPPGQTILQGGWWPRSWNPVAELPGLVLTLCAHYGPIREVVVNNRTWDRRFSRLAVDTGAVVMGWSASHDPALLTAVGARDERLRLLVVPPGTASVAAKQAMTLAADPANTLSAPDILASTSASAAPAPALSGSAGAGEQSGPR